MALIDHIYLKNKSTYFLSPQIYFYFASFVFPLFLVLFTMFLSAFSREKNPCSLTVSLGSIMAQISGLGGYDFPSEVFQLGS